MKTTSSICALGGLLLAACTNSGDKPVEFQVFATTYAVKPDTRVAISGFQIAYLADEHDTGTPASGGTILNADGDKDDKVVAFVNASSGIETNVGVAAQEIEWIGNELYLIVSENADGHPWNADADMDDVVLVHWSSADPTPRFVDTIDASGSIRMVPAGSRLFFTAAAVPAAGLESNICYVTTADPLTPNPVPTTFAAAPLQARILQVDEGLVFLGVPETVATDDLNNDGAPDGDVVLALLDGRAATSVIRNVGLAVPPANALFRAKFVSEGDWQVAFLVNEDAQGDTNFNAPGMFTPAWAAPQCAGHADTDSVDDIVFTLRFAAWVLNPVTDPPRNTGLVGSQKLAIANGFVATITPEEGAPDVAGEGTCDLNNDGDTMDRIARFAPIAVGMADVVPLNDVNNLLALFDVPGGTHGLAELANRFVIVVSETADHRDHDGNMATSYNLVAWRLPSTTVAPWQFLHSSPPSPVAASWVGEIPDRSRLGIALREEVGGLSINVGIADNPGDNDILDSVPTFAGFTTTGTLAFPGVAIGVDPANAGIVMSHNIGFYRVKEADDDRDWDNDGDTDDMILWRTGLDTGLSNINGVLNSATRPCIELSHIETVPVCAAFLIEEAKEGVGGTDVNRDGDKVDHVIQYFRFGP